MRAVAAIVALLFLAASLAAQGPAAATRPKKTGLSRKEAKNLQRVKKQALGFGKSDIVCVRLSNQSRVLGLITEISNQGIQFTEFPKEKGADMGAWFSNPPPPRFIPFSQIQSIKAPVSEQMSYFLLGSVSGLLGPLGWLTDWAMLTGRD